MTDRPAIRANLAALLAIARPILDPAAAGPCAGCGTPCRRYGDGASTLCPLCRDGRNHR